MTEDRFFWIKREVEKRPCFILAHQLIDVREDIALGAELHFYVGHTYDSQLTLIGAAPFEDGTLVFGATRIFTDKVTGFGSSLKKTFGRKVVARKIADRFERLRTRLEQ